MLKKKIFIYIPFLISAVLAAGCKTITVQEQVLMSYEALDMAAAGITAEDAKIIAQKALIDVALDKNYALQKPKVVTGPPKAPNVEQFWFVRFEEVERSSIPYIFMVVVDKRRGAVRFADDYPQDRTWVLESALYDR